MDEFMSKFYGPGATQRLEGGSPELNEYANLVKLSSETLGRHIGSSKNLDKGDNNIEGGEYEPPKSFNSIFEEEISKLIDKEDEMIHKTQR